MASMFSQLFGKGTEPADSGQFEPTSQPNRAERRARAKKAASAKRRGQRAYQRAVIEAEAKRYAAEKTQYDEAS